MKKQRIQRKPLQTNPTLFLFDDQSRTLTILTIVQRPSPYWLCQQQVKSPIVIGESLWGPLNPTKTHQNIFIAVGLPSSLFLLPVTGETSSWILNDSNIIEFTFPIYKMPQRHKLVIKFWTIYHLSFPNLLFQSLLIHLFFITWLYIFSIYYSISNS